jgi:hypothetical protein
VTAQPAMTSDPLEALLLAEGANSRFPPNSRYHGIGTGALELSDGQLVPYLRRRFVPQPQHLAELLIVRVADGDRLDRLAATHLGDPELFWRLCDANAVLRPGELTEQLGRELRVTLPEGTPGAGGG